MGRQILLGVSHADEVRLLDAAQKDGFVAVLRRPSGPDLSRAVRKAVPLDESASLNDYEWCVVPSGLMPELERALDRTTTGVPATFSREAEFLLSPITVPCIEWFRSRRDLQDRPPGGGRLYVDPAADHGELQHWLESVVAEFERLRRLVKAWTVRKGSVCVSKSLADRVPSQSTK